MFNFHHWPLLYQNLFLFTVYSLSGWAASLALLFIWEKLVMPLVSKTKSSLDDHLVHNIHHPITRLLVLGSVYFSAKFTIIAFLDKHKTAAKEIGGFINGLESILYLILVLLSASLLNGIIKGLIAWYMEDIAPKTESTLDDTLFPILRKAGTTIIYFIAVTIILGQFKVNLTGFLATAGVASLAIAFGAQETLANVIAGISILMDRSFHVGERIELKDGLSGDVVEIGLRSTKILSLDNRLIIVPNKEMAGSRLINWTQPDPATKVRLKIGVAVDEDLARVKKVITDTCARIDVLVKKTPVDILCTGFGPYYIEIIITASVKSYKDTGTATDLMIMELQAAFSRENIRLPFPQKDIRLIQ